MLKLLRFLAFASAVLAVESVALVQTQVMAVSPASTSPTPETSNRLRIGNSQGTLLAQTRSTLELIPSFDGNAYVMAHGGTFIGLVSSDPKANNSICNSGGTFGSDEGLLSIRNRYGNMGSLQSDISAYNSTAKYPPVLIFQGKRVAYLTKNNRFRNALDPDLLFDALCRRNFR